jgi:alpha-glucosidase (family GH31 glycosyl hydrolase)
VFHNPYPRLSAQAARDVLQAAKPDDHLFFVRAGYTGSQAVVPAVWGGDAEVSFDETQGIPSTIRSGLNLALVGVPYWGSDGTGFKCIGNALRDKEVFVRWLQIEAVSPIMMEQNACANPIERRTKWTLWSDEETQEVYRQTASLHTRLMPYFMSLAREAHEHGVPLMRPPFLYAPTEPKTWALDDTFFLGAALYAAPVIRRGHTTRRVWFPPGRRYVAIDDLTVWSGEADVPAPLTRLPLFLVEDQLLPMLDPAVQTLAPATVPGVVTAQSVADVLDVKAALGPTGSATITLIDGTVLTARRVAGDAGRAGFTEQADVSACTKCFNVTTHPGLTQVRVSATGAATFDELELAVSGPGAARRVRWEILRLP